MWISGTLTTTLFRPIFSNPACNGLHFPAVTQLIRNMHQLTYPSWMDASVFEFIKKINVCHSLRRHFFFFFQWFENWSNGNTHEACLSLNSRHKVDNDSLQMECKCTGTDCKLIDCRSLIVCYYLQFINASEKPSSKWKSPTLKLILLVGKSHNAKSILTELSNGRMHSSQH